MPQNFGKCCKIQRLQSTDNNSFSTDPLSALTLLIGRQESYKNLAVKILLQQNYKVHFWDTTYTGTTPEKMAAIKKQEAQLPLRNRASAMHSFEAKLLYITIMTYTCI